MKCPLCEAGNIITEVKDFSELEKHFCTHDIHILAMGYADLLAILKAKKDKKKNETM